MAVRDTGRESRNESFSDSIRANSTYRKQLRALGAGIIATGGTGLFLVLSWFEVLSSS